MPGTFLLVNIPVKITSNEMAAATDEVSDADAEVSEQRESSQQGSESQPEPVFLVRCFVTIAFAVSTS